MTISNEILELKTIAIHYSNLYTGGQCTREEAKEKIMPYLNLVNAKTIEIGKKYSIKPKKLSFLRL
ncbi:hypothetical protein [Clostridium estertheticum]|uniref:hypothetical protein n=1 Tax=Clostridium estertheticum TaxID=238834 RepID=UPI001CF370EB|nr:hypothetical protein [Clostridium estertheticum]MCB2359932.1 hypothetical protein [Clostridium estertheticum]